MRKIKYVTLHCTATHQSATVEAILRYWRETLGWKNPGYHYIVEPDGTTHNLHPENKAANGVRGHNANNIHISYIGGAEKDDRTWRQKQAMFYQIRDILRRYPQAQIMGHRDFPGAGKQCPRFDAPQWYIEHPLTLTT